ncbi:alpha/beta fold hydrolase [Streptacidiphilus jiangxiensis]|uniref:Lysophospholipase, alpha-beta hydrolase superfamily n=1 Tax=Streptacidiphilus jiangxiensis TaxID=235985 RepID=A0A1H7VM90_STRJI|nr:alpha/beta fold hydrolase [Streptacidiphilus jiangxiensis]SEM10412.1 Lysophospholipase, alpha-beta hydrolase superfamily [Streptacidiphilus jiangxiensis]
MSRLHVEEWGSGDRVAVLVHGITADSSSWWRTGPELASQGYRVLAPDLPGHGLSERWDSYTLQAMADAVAEAVPARPALAVGHSLGALLLAQVVDRLQPGKAVYVDPAWAAAPPDGGAMAAALRSQKDWDLERIQQVLPRWEAQAQQNKLTSLAHWDDTTLESFDGFAGLTPDKPAEPSLLVLADPSHNIPPQRAEELRALGFEVRTVPDTGHVVHNEDFDGFKTALQGWY